MTLRSRVAQTEGQHDYIRAAGARRNPYWRGRYPPLPALLLGIVLLVVGFIDLAIRFEPSLILFYLIAGGGWSGIGLVRLLLIRRRLQG